MQSSGNRGGMVPKLGSLDRNQKGCGKLFSPDRQTKHKAGKGICSGRCRKPMTEPGSTVTSPSPIPSLQLLPLPVPASTIPVYPTTPTSEPGGCAGGWGPEPMAPGDQGRGRHSQGICASALEGRGLGAAVSLAKGSAELWGAPSFVLGSPEGRSSAGLPREPRPILPAPGESLHGCEEGKKED